MSSLPQILPLLRRWPLCVACLAITLACAAGTWWVRGEIAALQVTHVERTREGESMLALLVSGSTQRAELDVVREATRRIDENLVVETNLAENLWYFYKLEEQTK